MDDSTRTDIGPDLEIMRIDIQSILEGFSNEELVIAKYYLKGRVISCIKVFSIDRPSYTISCLLRISQS